MNPNLEEAGKSTQFGQPKGANPSAVSGAGRGASIRTAQRYLAGQEVNPTSEKPFEDKLSEIKPTGAQLLAATILDKARAGDMRAAEIAIENIDGKVAQINLNADLQSMQGMSDDELKQIVSRFNSTAGGSAGSDGAATESPGEGDSTGEDERPAEAPDPAGV